MIPLKSFFGSRYSSNLFLNPDFASTANDKLGLSNPVKVTSHSLLKRLVQISARVALSAVAVNAASLATGKCVFNSDKAS